MIRDVLLQIGQVLTVLVLAPLLQGMIVQWGERVPRAPGPGISQPYRDLWSYPRFFVHEDCRHRGVPIFERLLERAGKMPAEFGVIDTDA